MRPDGSDMSPRMPPSCLTCAIEPRAPEVAIMNTGLSGFWAACIACVTSSTGLLPDLDRLVVALVVGDEALVEQTVELVDFGLRLVEQLVLGFGTMMSLIDTVVPDCVA